MSYEHLGYDAQLWRDVANVLPKSVLDKIRWIYPRTSWPYIEVAFCVGDDNHMVSIPKDEWLSDLWIARLCLEAP